MNRDNAIRLCDAYIQAHALRRGTIGTTPYVLRLLRARLQEDGLWAVVYAMDVESDAGGAIDGHVIFMVDPKISQVLRRRNIGVIGQAVFTSDLARRDARRRPPHARAR